jgi:hypothetical protein
MERSLAVLSLARDVRHQWRALVRASAWRRLRSNGEEAGAVCEHPR